VQEDESTQGSPKIHHNQRQCRTSPEESSRPASLKIMRRQKIKGKDNARDDRGQKRIRVDTLDQAQNQDTIQQQTM
jgi:hypothetical protein